MLLAYKYKLKPRENQESIMDNWLNMLRSLYNFCLRDRIEAYEQAKAPVLANFSRLDNLAECCPLSCSVSKKASIGYPWKKEKKRSAYEQQSSELKDLKKARPWYKQIHSTVLQQTLRQLDTAFQNFFKEGRGYPKFKTRQRFRSFTYPPNQVKIEENRVYLPSIGWMKFYNSRSISNGFKLKSVTLRKKTDGWYMSVRIEDKSVPQHSPISLNQVKSALGCDCGVKKLLALSNGEQIANPQYGKQSERRLAIRQRRASRTKKGSNNRKKAYQQVARVHNKVFNQRTDYQWKVANKLCRTTDVIVLEALNVKGMMARCKPKQDENGKYLKNGQSAKRALNNLIRDCAWGELKEKIKSVAAKFGLIVHEVNPRFTSQQCSQCGQLDASNRKGERFLCVECGYIADADNQAAVNIGTNGLQNLGISPSKLLRVPQKVTTSSESTETARDSRELSTGLPVEPSNPRQLGLSERRNGQAIGCSESPVHSR